MRNFQKDAWIHPNKTSERYQFFGLLETMCKYTFFLILDKLWNDFKKLIVGQLRWVRLSAFHRLEHR